MGASRSCRGRLRPRTPRGGGPLRRGKRDRLADRRLADDQAERSTAAQRDPRPDAAARTRRGGGHPRRLPRGRVGRSRARRHDVQRDQELPVGDGRAGARPRAARFDGRAGLRANRRRRVRVRSQRTDHLEAPAADDERVARHAVRPAGQRRLPPRCAGHLAVSRRGAQREGLGASCTRRGRFGSTTTCA